MPYRITLPDGSTVRTDHLSIDVVSAAAQEAETNWAHVVEAPHLGDGRAMAAIYRKACEAAGLEITETLTASNLPGYFESVESDVPDEFEGGLPDPQSPASPEADSPATTSSAGSRSTSSGPRRKRGPAASAT